MNTMPGYGGCSVCGGFVPKEWPELHLCPKQTSERVGDWMQVFSGGRFYPFDPRLEEIHIEDIAHSLALQSRFGGHCRVFYSTAEHSVRCSYVGPEEEALWRLLHDGSEAYLVDIPRPVKRHPDLFRYRQQERVNQHAIYLRFGLPAGFDAWGNVWTPDSVQYADEILLATEARDLMGNEALERWSSLKDIQPLPEPIDPWPWEVAERRFLERFRELT